MTEKGQKTASAARPGNMGAAHDPAMGSDRAGSGGPGNADGRNDPDNGHTMRRGLTGRHVQFIALGGAVGTGLFLGSGRSIALTGPSILLVYLFVGLIMFILMRAIGELMYADPSQHSFIAFITRYLGTGWGKFAGWTYWLVLVLIGMTELTAVSQYFVTIFSFAGIDLTRWRWLIQIGFMAILLAINLISAKAFGETEFWFSLIKISLIVGLIITGVVMAILRFHYPATVINGQHIPAGTVSPANIFADFQIAPNGWWNFALSFQMVFFAYETIEMIGMTVSEMAEPRKELKKAVNQLIYRILIFYVGALTAIMMIVPWRTFRPGKDGSFASPFIMVFRYAGLDWASTLVFLVVITAAASALNSLLFSAGRQLFETASESGSRRLAGILHVSSAGVPSRAIIVSALVILLAPLLSVIPGASGLFVAFSSMSSAVIIAVYILTLVAHWKYRNSDDFREDGFLLRGYKVWDSLAVAFFVFVYITLFFSADTLTAAVLGTVWLVLFGAWCVLSRRRAAKARAL